MIFLYFLIQVNLCSDATENVKLWENNYHSFINFAEKISPGYI